MLWLWAMLCVLLGFLLGYSFFAWRYRRSQRDELELLLELTTEDERLNILQQHVRHLEGVIAHYQQQIAQHFEQTAEHVNHFSQSYHTLFNHLQHDAYRLVDAERLAAERSDEDVEQANPQT